MKKKKISKKEINANLKLLSDVNDAVKNLQMKYKPTLKL